MQRKLIYGSVDTAKQTQFERRNKFKINLRSISKSVYVYIDVI